MIDADIVTDSRDRAGAGVPEYLEAAQTLQARHLAYLGAGDTDGLIANVYTADARIHTFGYRAGGLDSPDGELSEFMAAYVGRLMEFGDKKVEFFTAGPGYIWQELTMSGQTLPSPIEIYEFKFLREGRVYLQLMGEKSDTGWLAGAFAAAGARKSEVGPAAHVLHRRYVDYQSRGDADGMADDFFCEDATLATATTQIAGRESLRAFFRHKFVEDTGFHLVSIRNIAGDDDYVWFEATAASALGERTVYDVMLVQEGLVCTQLVGTLEGSLPSSRQ